MIRTAVTLQGSDAQSARPAAARGIFVPQTAHPRQMSDQYPPGFTLVRVMGVLSAISTFLAAIHSSLRLSG